jgi:hypothetical protein
LGANVSLGTNHANISTSYTTYSDTMTRPGGGSWGLTDFAQLIIYGMFTIATGRCTSLWLSVDYTPPPSTGNFFEMF